MQISSGTCTVTNGDTVVVASNGNDWSQATVNSLFGVPGAGAALYTIMSVTGPSVSSSGYWEIVISPPYQGSTDASASYAIHKDFSGTWGFPIIDRSDVLTQLLVNRAFMIIEQNFPAPTPLSNGFASITLSATGNTTITPTTGRHEEMIDVTAGSGAFTASIILDSANRAAGDSIQLNFTLAASTNPRVKVFSGGTSVAPLLDFSGLAAKIQRLSYRFVYDSALAAWRIDDISLPLTGELFALSTPVPAADSVPYYTAAAVAATGTLTLTANPLNNETVIIAGKTYRFKTALTPLANEVLIGATATASNANLAAAITLGAGSGTLYASATVLHPSATAVVGTATTAVGTLTCTVQPGNTETVVINGKTYTFQTTLTNVDGNVLRGANLAASMTNLKKAINLESGGGTNYAAATTLHATVTATSATSTTTVLAAKVAGAAGNLLTTTETLANGAFGAATLTGGTDLMTVTAKLAGIAGNSIATTETLTAGSFGASTLSGGVNVSTALMTVTSLARSFLTGVTSYDMRTTLELTTTAFVWTAEHSFNYAGGIHFRGDLDMDASTDGTGQYIGRIGDSDGFGEVNIGGARILWVNETPVTGTSFLRFEDGYGGNLRIKADFIGDGSRLTGISAGGTITLSSYAWVDGSGDDGTALLGRPDKPFNTVQAAIDAIQTEGGAGTIILGDGVYDGGGISVDLNGSTLKLAFHGGGKELTGIGDITITNSADESETDVWLESDYSVIFGSIEVVAADGASTSALTAKFRGLWISGDLSVRAFYDTEYANQEIFGLVENCMINGSFFMNSASSDLATNMRILTSKVRTIDNGGTGYIHGSFYVTTSGGGSNTFTNSSAVSGARFDDWQ